MKDSINYSNRKTQYSRYYSSFKGIDVSKKESEIAPYRFPYLVNMYRDYYSKNRDMIETVPGYRVLTRFENQKINGIFSFTCGNEYLLIHAGTSLYAVRKERREYPSDYILVYSLLENSRSAGKTFGDKFYLLDGSSLYGIGITGGSFTCVKVSENAYQPVLTYNGKDRMQKNILTDSYFEKYDNPILSKYYENGGIVYSLYESSGKTYAKVTGANSLLSKIYIPSETVIGSHRYKVGMIGNSAFSNNRNLEEIVISKEVKTIEGASGNAPGAFYNCSLLSKVVLHGISSIGEKAFRGCNRIKDLWLCDEITSESIDGSAFENIECNLYFCGRSASVIEERFPQATVYSNCRLYEARENDTVETPYESSEYERAFTKSDSHNYIGDPCDNNGFWEVKMISSSSLAVSGFRNSSVYSYAGFTIMKEENGYVETFDECERFSFILKDGCSSVSYVSVNGNVISLSPYVMTGQRFNYEVETLGSLCKRIIITGRKSELESAEILFSCISQNEYVGKNDDLIDFKSYSGYTGSFKDAINKCRILTVYNGSLLLSGNPDLPDLVFASCKEESGKKNPSYFGIYSYIPTGSEKIANSAFVQVSSYIAVLKEKHGDIFLISDSSKDNSFAESDYSVERKEGYGAFFDCAVNFHNDPVYLSERGLELFTGKSFDSVSLRHSSSYIDNMLTSEKNLRASSLAVWQGYLAICVDGHIYLADSRDHDNIFGYEWYYLEGIGSYVGDSLKYRHLSVYPAEDTDYSERYRILGTEDEIIDETVYSERYEGNTVYYVMTSGEKYMVDSCGEKTGGVFSGADIIYSDGNILLFGTKDGTLSSFNNDKRGESVEINGTLEETKDGYIHRSFYTFANHSYFSGFKTKNDDCGYPHIAKDTVKNSLTVSMNSYPGLSVHAKVRKDSLPYRDIGFIKGGDFSVFDMDFDSFTFKTSESVTSTLYERERRWSSKQFLFYSDSYMKPFAVSFIAYRWSVFGRLSERDQ